MTATPIPAGVLLAGPPRPDGVPDDAVPAVLWFGPDNGAGACVRYAPNGQAEMVNTDLWRERGVPVPPYQPAPDPAIACTCTPEGCDEEGDPGCAFCQSLDPEEGCPVADAEFDQPTPPAPEPALDGPELHRRMLSVTPGTPASALRDFDPQPVTEARTGPLGLSEQDTREAAGWKPAAEPQIRALTRECRVVVARWDAEDAPATPETLADIEADSARVLLHQFSEWIDSERGRIPASATHDDLIDMFFMERPEAARPFLADRDPTEVASPLTQRRRSWPPESTDMVADAMQQAWNEFCADTDCYPDCIINEGRGRLSADFRRGNFAAMVAEWIEAASRPDPDTITVNLPVDVHRRFAHACYTPRDVDAVALAAAGLPQEPTEGGEQ